MNGNGRNMYVFRDGRRSLAGARLAEELADSLRRLASPSSGRDVSSSPVLTDCLLRAGELECALDDAGSPETPRLAVLTDWLARLRVGAECCRPEAAAMLELMPQQTPSQLSLAPAEGFAYYGLHPLDFAGLAARVPVRGSHVAVIGIRSIGTTLSALVAAAFLKRGLHVERIAVRPTGHPYDRHTEFAPAQLRWLARRRADQAKFVVADEGPGMSGSSFLSVGEALLGAGVARTEIQFLCSREPDIQALCARNAAARWSNFQFAAVPPTGRLPAEARVYIGSGFWRHELMGPDPAVWPASWTQMERTKFLSPDHRWFFKFDGFGRFGEEIRQRAQALSEAGYVAAPGDSDEGFGCYRFVPGTMLTAAQADCPVLQRIAQYCAFRWAYFRSCEEQNAGQIETMVRFNLGEEFGRELNGSLGRLGADHPVLVDGRMSPHEWIRARDGRLLKCDAVSHGDDHFFPGPATDICWDLAGTIVEWDLQKDAAEYFVRCYQQASGDDPRPRLPGFLLAYAVFRSAYCKMAAAAMSGSDEEKRLLQTHDYYRGYVESLLPRESMAA
jgi:hypothetical protein